MFADSKGTHELSPIHISYWSYHNLPCPPAMIYSMPKPAPLKRNRTNYTVILSA